MLLLAILKLSNDFQHMSNFCKRGQSFTFKEVTSLYKQSNIVKHLHLSTFNVLS